MSYCTMLNHVNNSLLFKVIKKKSHIRKLINVNGEEITDQKLILEEMKSFYTNLYTSKSQKTERECLQYIASL